MASHVVVAVGGAAVLLSYYLVFGGEGSYLGSPYWLGLPRGATGSVAGAQVVAALGFVLFLVAVTRAPPRVGVLSRPAALPVTLGVFLAASVAWPWLVRASRAEVGLGPYGFLTSVSLVVAAAAVVVLLAGTFEAFEASDGESEGWRTAALWGAAAVALVVVLLDGVGWNARFLHGRLRGDHGRDEVPDAVGLP